MKSFENSHVLQECVQKETTLDLIIDIKDQSQPSSAGGTRSTPAMPHRLQNLKWLPGGSKMADKV